MTTSAKTGSSGRHKNANGKQNGSYHIFDEVLALAGTFARDRKDFGAEKLHSLAESSRDFATSMTDVPNLRVQMASAGESLENLAEYVLHTDIEHMLEDAGTFARRRPLTALTMTIIAGMAASRFMRSRPARAKTASNRGNSLRRKTVSRSRKHATQPRRGTNGKVRAHA
jgi:hypothetical protein